MRPVNLIPPEERVGERAPARTGPVVYLVVGVLAVLLLGVFLRVQAGNTIKERTVDRDRLQALKTAAEAQSQKLGSYIEFQAIQAKRVGTVMQLAQSRFDWERVLRELALVLPDDVWLVKLRATVSPKIELKAGGGALNLRKDVQGPALEMTGCGHSHESVARFLTRLRDIDGVTRVAVVKSERPGEKEVAGGGGKEEAEDCRRRDTIPLFEVIAAFEAVSVAPAAPGAAPGAAQPAAGGAAPPGGATAQAPAGGGGGA